MIAGRILIDHEARTLHTQRDSYRLDGLSVVSVRHPFLPAGIITTLLAGGFALQFGDLLYPGELLTVVGIAITSMIAGCQIGRLSLLSRDLRGSPLSGVIWGRAATLQAMRHTIIAALTEERAS